MIAVIGPKTVTRIRMIMLTPTTGGCVCGSGTVHAGQLSTIITITIGVTTAGARACITAIHLLVLIRLSTVTGAIITSGTVIITLTVAELSS